jgi:hypothetical protein
MATQQTVLQGAFEECVKEMGDKVPEYRKEEFLYGVVDGTMGWWRMNAFGDIYFLGTTTTEVLEYAGDRNGGNQNG